MTESIFKRLEGDWFHHGQPHDPSTSAAPAAAQPEEKHMSLSADHHTLAAKLETIGDDAVDVLEHIKANPETADLLGELHALATTAGIPQGYITGVGQALKVLRAAYTSVQTTPAAEQPVPASS